MFSRILSWEITVSAIVATLVLLAWHYPSEFFVTFGILLGVLLAVSPSVWLLYLLRNVRGLKIVWWYLINYLAGRDFIFTKFKAEGRYKITLRMGGFKEVLLNKKKHKLNDNGRIVKLRTGEVLPQGLPGGVRRIGWPLIDTIYKEEMNFKKASENGIEDRKNSESEFLAKQPYPYALVFKDCEDGHNIPITGYAVLLAEIDHPYKAHFGTPNFYQTMLGLTLSVVRECFESYSLTGQRGEMAAGDGTVLKKEDLDHSFWEALGDPDKNPQPGSNLSVVEELWKKFGIRLLALRTVQIDPPEHIRASAQKKWQAEMDRDAARVIAEKEAEETEGRVLQAVAKACGMTREELEDILAANPNLKGLRASDGGLKDDFDHARDLLKRDRAGEGLEDIRVGNVDGTPLEPVTGVIAAMFGLKQRQGGRRKKNGGKASKNPGRKGGKKKRVEDMDEDDLNDYLDDGDY